MRILTPPAVYISDRVRGDERCMARLERMMARIECDNIVDVTDEDIADLIAEQGWGQSRRYSGARKAGDPAVIFNRFNWSSGEEATKGVSRFYGGSPWVFRDRDRVLESGGIVCQSAWELHSVHGCLFKCAYCNFDNFLNIMLDLEEWLEHVKGLIDRNPWQSLYKYDSNADILTLDPEYGASELLVPFFAGQPNAFLMHYTKSDNVDHLLDYDHNGHTIVCWSLSCHTSSRIVEPETATMEQRIEAARKCQEAGYPVRIRFSPIVPIRNWREENRDMIRLLLSKVTPEVITLQTLSRFREYDIVERIFDTDIFDPRFLEAMRARPDDVRDKLYGPIPHELRKEIFLFCFEEIRKITDRVPVSVCLESEAMWNDLEPVFGISREAYPCACGGRCAPGSPVMTPNN